MAMVNCPHCNAEISSEAKKCPQCGKMVKRKQYIGIIAILAVVVIGVASVFGWNQYQKIQEERLVEAERLRQEQIDTILAQVDELYREFDFDGIETCYDSLDKIGYSTEDQRTILEYDKSVYEDAYGYYKAITNLEEKLKTRSFSSLRALVSSMRSPTKKLEALEANSKSEIGKYIINVRSNMIYLTFNAQFIDDTTLYSDLDYYLTQGTYAIVLEGYAEEIAKVKFPYVSKP